MAPAANSRGLREKTGTAFEQETPPHTLAALAAYGCSTVLNMGRGCEPPLTGQGLRLQ